MEAIDYKVSKVNLYEQVAEKLEKVILSGLHGKDQKLPSEQELAKNFGVSRNVVRESLKLLKERGLVVLRTGEGTYITQPNSETLTRIISRMLLMKNISSDDTYEMSILLESKAAALASINALDADIEMLLLINDEMLKNEKNLPRRVQLDVEFHKLIGAMSHNLLLEIFVNSMTDLRIMTITKAIQTEGGSEDGIHYHRKVIDAIKLHDPALAGETMKEHLIESRKRHDWAFGGKDIEEH